MRLKTAAVGLLLMGVTLGSAALTLGRARGAAWIGQPLELAVITQLDSGQAANSLCAEADVFYADNRLESGKVQVSVEAAPQADTAIIRIISSALVDEPVVTVYVRAGCAAKTSRRYVLLADYQSDTVAPVARAVEAPVVATVAPAATAVAAPAPAAAPATVPIPSAAATPTRSKAPVVQPRTEAPPRESRAPRKSAAEPREPRETKEARASKSRLKLDPIEHLAERIKSLEASSTAAPTEEMQRESQRIQQLQSDIKTLLEQAAKNEASLQAMRARLDRAESDRVPAWLLYALLLITAACVAAVGVLWNRRDPSAWRSGLADALPARAMAATLEAESAEPEQDTEAITQAGAPKPAALKRQGRPQSDPLDMGAMPFESYVTVNAPLIATDSEIMAFGAPAPGMSHPNFNSSKQFDLCQQSEFFTKLGKANEAIGALEARIRENSRDCPLIYLELLRVANQHSLKTDFRQFRDEFTTVFNVQVPEFALFRDEGRGLEAYPGVLSHIAELWPSPQVMDVIEACVLISPGEKNAARFDLAAFRELVMLHGLVYAQTHPETDADMLDEADSEHVSLDL